MPLPLPFRIEKLLLIAALSVIFLAGYLGIAQHTAREPARSLATPLDHAIPYVPAVWPVYQSVYLLVLLPTGLYARRSEMRAGAAANLACMVAAYAFFLLFPVRILPPPEASVAQANASRFALLFDDRGMNCFPSLHLAMATLAALCCARADRRLGVIAWVLTALIAISSLLLKRHYAVDLPAGVALGGACYAIFLRGRLSARERRP